MKKIINNVFEEKVKISVNLSKKYLDQIEKIANLTESPRGIVLEAIGFHGIPLLLDDLESSWKGLLGNASLSEKKKKKIRTLLEKLKKLKKEILESYIGENATKPAA